MKQKTVRRILLLALAVTVAVGVFLWRRTDAAPPIPEVSSQGFAAMPTPVRRISVTRHPYDHGTYRTETSVLEKRDAGGWRMTAPVDYPVNVALVHEMVAALEGIAPSPLEGDGAEGDLERWALVPPHAIAVTVAGPDRPPLAFVVGRTERAFTYLRLADTAVPLKTPGHLRKVFDRGPAQLRSHRITDFDNGAIARMTFHNAGTPFTLERIPGPGAPRFRPVGGAIPNFDNDLAVHRAAALSRLRARGFYDGPHPFSDDALRVTLEVMVDDAPRQEVLTFGERDAKSGLHFAAVASSPQVFLLSPHMKALFTATPADFAQTDAQVERRRIWREKAAAHLHDRHRRHSVAPKERGSDDDRALADTDLEDHVE